MKIISAGAIMDPVQADGRIDGGPVVTKNTNIEALIALSDGQAPITVIDESGNVIGQITTKRLLRSIAGPHAEVSISEQNQVSLPSDDLEDVEGI